MKGAQGWQYRMTAYQRQFRERELVQCMSRNRNCHDNAAMESFFGVLKTKYFYSTALRRYGMVQPITFTITITTASCSN
jgi:transposase InsO family protein